MQARKPRSTFTQHFFSAVLLFEDRSERDCLHYSAADQCLEILPKGLPVSNLRRRFRFVSTWTPEFRYNPALLSVDFSLPLLSAFFADVVSKSCISPVSLCIRLET